MQDQRLRYFLVSAEEQSLTRAAQRLGLSQAALSQQIRKLEENLGGRLFERRGRGVELTAAGKRLAEELQGPFAQIDQALAEVAYAGGARRDTIRLASVQSLYGYYVPAAIRAFADDYPEVDYVLDAAETSAAVVHATLTHAADLGLTIDTMVAHAELDVTRLFDERIVAVLRSDSPALRQIEQDGTIAPDTPMIMYSKSSALRRMIDRALRDTPLKIKAEVNTLDTMLWLAQFGVGVCLLPEGVPLPAEGDARLVARPLAIPNLVRQVVMIRRADEPLRPLVAAFAETLRKAAKHVGTPVA